MKPHYSFTAKLWMYAGDNPWYFVTLPKDQSEEIRAITSDIKKGFGSVRVQVKIGVSQWDTSIFPDSKSDSYVLPIKKEVRSANELEAGDKANVSLTILGL